MFQFNSQKTGFSAAKQGYRTSKKKRFYQSALALGLMAGLMGACAENAAQRETSDGSTNVQTEEVAENTEGYIGQVVTIRSEPLEKIGDSTFTVSDKRFLSSEPILVINTSGAPWFCPKSLALRCRSREKSATLLWQMWPESLTSPSRLIPTKTTKISPSFWLSPSPWPLSPEKSPPTLNSTTAVP
jgi:hypothetical protein